MLSPQLKITVWLLFIAAAAAVIQLCVGVVNVDFNILSQQGRGYLLVLALGSLLVLMLVDRRPAADYGLVVTSKWSRHALHGFAIGALFYGGYCGIGLLLGVFSLRTETITPYRCTSATLSALAAFPIAATQQIIFSGYLISSLRDRMHRTTAVLISATLFGALSVLDDPATMFNSNSMRLGFSMFLIGALLGLMRLRFGSLIFPACLLAGCIFVRKIVSKTALLAAGDQSGFTTLMAPNYDPRQAPMMWAVLVVSSGVFWHLLRRDGEPATATGTSAIDASFKRVLPFSNLMSLAPLDLWLRQLMDARFHIGLQYLPRLAWVFIMSAINTILSLPERILAPWLLRHRVPDPIFIVGVHRSGTTHLHNLLSLDSRFCTPRTCHAINPNGWLSTGWLTTALLGPFMTWKRPMDGMSLHIFSPQEEEFAMAGMSRLSPYWGITFPRRWAEHEQYVFVDSLEPSQRNAWKRQYLLLLRKLTFWKRKSPLLKSPYNTGRVAALREIFPKAKFIHIHRDPRDVYRSNMHLAREGFVVFQLQDPDESDSYQTRFLDNYRRLEETFYRDSSQLPADDVVDVKFEDLERDPAGQVRQIYDQLGLTYDEQFRDRLQRYLSNIAGYQKNRLKTLPDEQQRQIKAKMGKFMEQWGYADSQGSVPHRPAKAA